MASVVSDEYFNFVCNAIVGKNPDGFYRQHKKVIDQDAKQLVYKFKSKPQKVWRGLILYEHDVKDSKLKPLQHITYLSFSEDIEIAKTFGDPEHPMGAFFKIRDPSRNKGYLIEYEYDAPRELLFHWRWAQYIGIFDVLPWDTILEQREVMLKQRMLTFDVKPLEAGCSLGNLNRTHEKYESDNHKELRKKLAEASLQGCKIIL